MRPRSAVLGLVVFLCSAPVLQAQSTSSTATIMSRDPQAVTLLRQSVAAIAPTPLADSMATGNVTITAGSQTTQGTVSIMTKGTTETSIQFQMPNSTWSIIYSGGQANRIESATTTVLPLELAASSQCLYFPQPYLSGLLSNNDVALEFMGQESLGPGFANHIRALNTFNSSTVYQFLSDFTVADIWLDATSALPVQIAVIRRYGGGSSPRIPIFFVYSNYQSVYGVRYPFAIQEYVTGTLWATTTIQSVNFNTGLTESNFPVVLEGN